MPKYTPNVIKIVKQVRDTRRKQGRRYTTQVLVWMLLLGTILGETHLVEICDLFRYNKKLRGCMTRLTGKKLDSIPHSTTVSRALQKLQLGNLIEYLNKSWSSCELKKVLVAGDGKVMKGIHDGSKRQILTFVDQNMFPLYQAEIDSKENEITALVNLLKTYKLKLPKGSIITLDAIHTQVSVLKQLRKESVDYLPKVKGNQKELQRQLAYIFHQGKLDKSYPLKTSNYKTFQKAHDRFTTWDITTSTDFCAKDLPIGFESVKTIGFKTVVMKVYKK